MSEIDDATAIVTQLQALHDSLVQAWGQASNAGNFAQAKIFNAAADEAADQLILARQYLLTAIENGQNVATLQKQMAGIADAIKAQQAAVTKGTANLTTISSVLDAVNALIMTAQTIHV